VFKKKAIVFLLFCGFVNYILPSADAQDLKTYFDDIWGFRVSIPANWHYTTSSQIIAQADQGDQPQKAQIVRDTGLVVTISEFSLDAPVKFNPNINIAAKNIELTPKPRHEKQIIDYAKNILSATIKTTDLKNIKEIRINGLVGVEAVYRYQLPTTKEVLNIFGKTTILIDRQSNNYFILTASCLFEKNKEFMDIFNDVIKSFRYDKAEDVDAKK